MFRRFLISISLISLASVSLSSCSIWNKFRFNKYEVASVKETEEPSSINSYENAPLDNTILPELTNELDLQNADNIDLSANATLMSARNKRKIIAVPYEEKYTKLQGISCAKVVYNSLADKVQTLGYIKSGTEEKYHVTSKAKVKNINKVVKNNKPRKIIKVKPQDAVSVENSNLKPNIIQDKQISTQLNEQTSINTPDLVNPHNDEIKANSEGLQPSSLGSETAQNNQLNVETKNVVESPTTLPIETLKISDSIVLEFQESEIDISSPNSNLLNKVVETFKANNNKNIKLQSFAYLKDQTNSIDARKTSLQRAIKVRKYLIDNGVNASHISVNAIEDINNKRNEIKISFEG